MRHRLYLLQQRLAITQAESTVALFAAVAILIGFVAGPIMNRPPALPADVYAEPDRWFAEGVASMEAAEPLPQAASLVAGDEAALPRHERPPGGPIDLNTATADELMRLPRIGPKLAERILAFRTSRGGFRSVDDLAQVRGIGPKTLEQLAPLVTTE